jgi:hypothetical protein
MFDVSRPQTPSPLIRPASPEFGGAERGESQKLSSGSESFDYYFGCAHSAQ